MNNCIAVVGTKSPETEIPSLRTHICLKRSKKRSPEGLRPIALKKNLPSPTVIPDGAKKLAETPLPSALDLRPIETR